MMTETKKITIGVWVYTESFKLQRTLDSIWTHTPDPFILVLLSDGPDAITAEALGQLRNIPLLATNRSLGAPACFNRLIAHDEADVVVFLESGSVVTAGWLEGLLGALRADPGHGLAGPSTNLAWNEQRLKDAPDAVAPTQEVEVYAAQVAQRYHGTYRSLEPLHSLSDFCYAVKREVIESIGGADETYGLGPCWEMDYNIRAARAGFKGVWACGVYVHRLPLTTRRVQEEARLTEVNKRRYQNKFCRLKLENKRQTYCVHCLGEVSDYFAPKELIQIRSPFLKPEIPTGVDLISCATPTEDKKNDEQEQQNSSEIQVKASDDFPLVSCIMPTYNRRGFVPQAIKYFLRQDYSNKELVIVDDGTDKVGDLIPVHEQIRYVRLDQKASVGYKRNVATEQSKGEIIAHWDDDDWYHPSYLKELVYRLLQSHEKQAISGLSGYLVYILEDSTLKICKAQGIAGATFCYFKTLWQKHPYRDVLTAEDYFFLQDIKPCLTPIDKPELFVVIRHKHHTWKQERGINIDTYLRRLKNYSKRFDEIADGGDCRFYECLKHELYTGTIQNEKPSKRAPEKPLVSCIMPTYNRRWFVPQAIKYFFRQDYPDKELVIVDDGLDNVADLIPADDRIKYIRLERRISIGYKRNLAVEKSKGEIVMHWDDDDWYAENRISYQVQPLLEKKAEVSGLDTGFIYDILENTFWSCAPTLHAMMFYADIHGGSIAYARNLWENYARYPDTSLAEDAAFLRAISNKKARIIKLPNKDVFIYLRHSTNAWEFICGNFINPKAWKKIPLPSFLSREDLNFYEEILSKFSMDSNACKHIADSFRLGGNYEAALRYYDRALELDSVNVWAWYDKGQTLEQLGQYEKALHAVLEANKLLHPQDNNRTWVHSGLGTLYLQLDHKSQAKEQFETALRYNGKNHIARECLKKV